MGLYAATRPAKQRWSLRHAAPPCPSACATVQQAGDSIELLRVGSCTACFKSPRARAVIYTSQMNRARDAVTGIYQAESGVATSGAALAVQLTTCCCTGQPDRDWKLPPLSAVSFSFTGMLI